MPDDLTNVTYQQLVLERHDRVAIIRMNRPRYRNAQSRILREELDDAFDRCRDDDSVHVVVLAGAGEHFSGGHDLGTPEEKRDQELRPYVDDFRGRYHRTYEFNVENTLRWRDFPKPTIAAVHGYCIFAGWMLAAAMDVVIAADDTKFLPELVQYFSMPYDVGARKTKEILFEGRFVEAEEARELGFVNRVVPRAELEAYVLDLAQRFADNDLYRLEMTKRAVNAATDAQGYRQAIEAGYMYWKLSSESERAAAGNAGTTVASDGHEGRPRRPRAQRAFDNLRKRESES